MSKKADLIIWSVVLDLLGIGVMFFAGNLFYSVLGIAMILIGAFCLIASFQTQPQRKTKKKTKK